MVSTVNTQSISPIDYRNKLSTEVNQLTLHESNWKSVAWKKTWEGINQEILNDAFNQHDLVKATFKSVGTIEPRKCKSITRVEKKMTEQAPGRENFFKVVSDFVAGRIYCNVNEIQEKIDTIRNIVLAEKGQIHVRWSSDEQPYGSFIKANKQYADITQYVYVFIEKIGYPIELQIGHKLAAHTFTIDSAIRDNKECGLVDLWNKNFYLDARQYILDKANGVNPGSKEAILAKAAEIHQGDIPDDLQTILDAI